MSIEPADEETRGVIFDILSRFLFVDWQDQSLGPLIGEIYRVYRQIDPVDVVQLKAELDKNPDVRFWKQQRYLWLEPSESKKILPLLTLMGSDQLVHFRLYTLLVMLDDKSELQSLAIRFETDEGYPSRGGPGAHDFCHAQLCKYIDDNICATTPKWLPDSQPSIPLDANGQIGLVLCMLISLYGGAHVFDKLSESGDKALIGHMQNVRALQRP